MILANPTLYVLSDLHLAPPSDLLCFHSHEHLVSLIDHLSQQATPQHLVLNGDVFDFLQLPGYSEISIPLAPQRMTAILDALEAEPAPRNIVQALQRFTACGHVLHCLPGNHDPELNLHRVQDVLAARLGASSLLPFNQGCWSMQIGQLEVLGMHGHWKDPYNAITAEKMLQAQANGDASVSVPPGSRLVRDVLNPYRRALDSAGGKRFPFIDLLPSEMAILYALLYLDPKLAGKRIATGLGVGAHALQRSLALALQPARLLAGGAPTRGTDSTGESAEQQLLTALAANLVECLSPNERNSAAMIQREIDAYLQAESTPQNTNRSGGSRGQNSASMLAEGDSNWMQRWLLRGIARELASARSAFAPGEADTLASDSIRGWGQGSAPTRANTIALTGHTHAAKEIPHAGGVYLNTGTWQDLVRIPDDLSIDAIASWLQALQEDRIPRWRRCPVVRVDENGAELLHWDGSVLQTWDSALA